MARHRSQQARNPSDEPHELDAINTLLAVPEEQNDAFTQCEETLKQSPHPEERAQALFVLVTDHPEDTRTLTHQKNLVQEHLIGHLDPSLGAALGGSLALTLPWYPETVPLLTEELLHAKPHPETIAAVVANVCEADEQGKLKRVQGQAKRMVQTAANALNSYRASESERIHYNCLSTSLLVAKACRRFEIRTKQNKTFLARLLARFTGAIQAFLRDPDDKLGTLQN
jgi:hypothetical protein